MRTYTYTYNIRIPPFLHPRQICAFVTVKTADFVFFISCPAWTCGVSGEVHMIYKCIIDTKLFFLTTWIDFYIVLNEVHLVAVFFICVHTVISQNSEADTSCAHFPLILHAIIYPTMPLTLSKSQHGIRNKFSKIFKILSFFTIKGKKPQKHCEAQKPFLQHCPRQPQNFFKNKTKFITILTCCLTLNCRRKEKKQNVENSL